MYSYGSCGNFYRIYLVARTVIPTADLKKNKEERLTLIGWKSQHGRYDINKKKNSNKERKRKREIIIKIYHEKKINRIRGFQPWIQGGGGAEGYSRPPPPPHFWLGGGPSPPVPTPMSKLYNHRWRFLQAPYLLHISISPGPTALTRNFLYRMYM